MPLATGFITKQLNRLPRESGLRLEPHYAWLRCPYHNRGRERTGSLRVNLDRTTDFRIGSYQCFGCAEHGQWNDLAKTLKLKRYKATADDEFNLEISEQLRENLLGVDAVRDVKTEIKFAPIWPKKSRWRGIPGWLLADIKARLTTTKYGDKLYLPVSINKEIVGGITCALENRSRGKYIYDSGQWIRQALFPFDYVKRLLRKKRKHRRIIFLVEGSRDALRLLSFGIPALSIMGGVTVWRKQKADLLLSLDPDLIVLAFDPDKIGRRVTKKVFADLNGQVKLQRLRFSNKPVKQDPGNMPEWRITKIKRKLNI